MIYTVTLNPALDYVMKVGKLRFDDINRTDWEKIYYGGKGINVSVILSRLGYENKALGFVGGFTGDKLEEMLKNDGVCCNFDHLSDGFTRINVKIKADSEIDVNALGPNVDEGMIDSLILKFEDLHDGDYVVLAGSIPASMPDDIYMRILKKLRHRGINCVVDTTGDLLKNVLEYQPFLIKPNHHELGDLFGVEIKNDFDVVKYSKKLQDMGAKNVLVSCAKDGAILVDENGVCRKIGNASGKVVNSVGCGDSMVAGFVAGYINKSDYEYALRMGSACGNATAFSDELATKEEIENMFSNYFENINIEIL